VTPSLKVTDPATVSAAEQARTVVLQMIAERGRGVVLVGADRLDLVLEHLLLAVMAPSSDPDDKLFTPDRSLGSIGGKISLAARLGLIESTSEKALHAIRSVRNNFAHQTCLVHPQNDSKAPFVLTTPIGQRRASKAQWQIWKFLPMAPFVRGSL
jgi:hypothetical protein